MEGLTKDEEKIYDRQIRIYGTEVQEMLKKAKVLVVNVRNGSISEAIRHIVLSGVQVDILDNTFILKDNLEMLLDTHFLIKPEHLGMKISEALKDSLYTE